MNPDKRKRIEKVSRRCQSILNIWKQEICNSFTNNLLMTLFPGRELAKLFYVTRFGKAEWLQPYTEPTLIALAKQGVARVDVMCPGFTADCLETLEEIDQEAREAFLEAGGKEFHYIPCLNVSHPWITALADLAIRHMQGWPAKAGDPKALEAQRQRALAAGATD